LHGDEFGQRFWDWNLKKDECLERRFEVKGIFGLLEVRDDVFFFG